MTSVSDNISAYKKIALLSSLDDKIFNNFKQEPDYRIVLEHVSIEQGQQFLNVISRDNPHLLELHNLNIFKLNDILGGADIHNYNGIHISPSTLRYIKVLSDLIKLFGTLDNKNIIEIGSGYGGQALLILKFFKNVKYTFVDLDECLELQKKYLDKHGINNEVLKFKKNNFEDNYDLVISNYAFSECSRNIQYYYIDNIINKSRNCYMTINDIYVKGENASLNLEETKHLIKKIYNIIDEEPQTGQNNCILYF